MQEREQRLTDFPQNQVWRHNNQLQLGKCWNHQLHKLSCPDLRETPIFSTKKGYKTVKKMFKEKAWVWF